MTIPPHILQSAFDAVGGIEKQSDVTLVMEEVRRLMDEQRQRFPLPWRIEYDNDTGPNDEGFWCWWDVLAADGERVSQCHTEEDAKWIVGLGLVLRAATGFIEEAESTGWGKTSETALPGSFDNLRSAIKEVTK